MQGTIDLIRKAIRDESTTTNRSACSAVSGCLHILLDSKYFEQGFTNNTSEYLYNCKKARKTKAFLFVYF